MSQKIPSREVSTPRKIFGSADLENSLKEIKNKKFMDFVNVKDYGAKGDGVTDDTQAIQAALDNGNIFFPAGIYMVNGNDPDGISSQGRQGVRVPSNRVITWLDGAEVHVIPNAEDGYNAFLVHEENNILFTSPNIKGERDDHTGTTGEWGMGIEISSSTNVKIESPFIRNCWGDGIYIGQVNAPCENITINNGIFDNNRRQGLSVISVNGLHCENSIFKNTNGTGPGAGVDIEPNANSAILDNIAFIDCKFMDNEGSGFLIYTPSFSDIENKRIKVDLIGCTSKGNANGYNFSGWFNVGEGNIRMTSCHSTENLSAGVKIRRWHHEAPKIEIDLTSVNDNEYVYPSKFGSPVSMYRDAGEEPIGSNTGGVEIKNLKTIFTKTTNDTGYDLSIRDDSTNTAHINISAMDYIRRDKTTNNFLAGIILSSDDNLALLSNNILTEKYNDHKPRQNGFWFWQDKNILAGTDLVLDTEIPIDDQSAKTVFFSARRGNRGRGIVEIHSVAKSFDDYANLDMLISNFTDPDVASGITMEISTDNKLTINLADVPADLTFATVTVISA